MCGQCGEGQGEKLLLESFSLEQGGLSLSLSLVVFLFVSRNLGVTLSSRKFNSLLIIKKHSELSGANMGTCQTSAIRERIGLWI